MELNWKDRFKNKNSNRLFEIFSEQKRINIEPQIFAGNILFDRNFDLESLKKVKQDLIDSIEESFHRKFNTDPKKIRKENIKKEIILRALLSIIIFAIFYNSVKMEFSYSFLNIDNISLAYILAITSFLPLIWLKKSNDNAIKKVDKEIEKKNKMIQKINTDLKF